MSARAPRPVVVQHSFGDPGSGGPIVALQRLLDSPLADQYEFVRMHQEHAAGGVDLRMVRRWAAMLREVRPDLVHVRGLGNEGFHGALAARLARVPAVLVSIHGTVRDLTVPASLRRSVLVRAVEPATLTMATDVVTVCRATAERAFLDPWRDKLRAVVPNGIDTSQPAGSAIRESTRSALGIPADRVVLVVVGRLSHEKGHDFLARAMGSLPPRVLARTMLLLVGDGPDCNTIVDAYESVPGLDLRTLGRRHDVADLLRASDVFVFPTLHENLSNALLEAMSVGLPVIATSVGGNVEVLKRGGGLLVPQRDAQALAGAVAHLVDDAAERKAMGSAARSVIEWGFTLDHMVGGWDAVYAEAIARSER